jgi:hypothetical protein
METSSVNSPHSHLELRLKAKVVHGFLNIIKSLNVMISPSFSLSFVRIVTSSCQIIKVHMFVAFFCFRVD